MCLAGNDNGSVALGPGRTIYPHGNPGDAGANTIDNAGISDALAHAISAANGSIKPDAQDPANRDAALEGRMRALAATGFRSTFATSLRGTGGPSIAASNDQLQWRNPGEAAPAAPAPSTPPAIPGVRNPDGVPTDPNTGLPIEAGPGGPTPPKGPKGPKAGGGWWTDEPVDPIAQRQRRLEAFYGL